MLHKFIHRNEGGHAEMNDSALRDIIPSNDIDLDDEDTQKPRGKRFLHVCKIFVFTIILGLLAIGIVIIALILAYSGRSFVNFIVQSAESNSFLSSDPNSTSTLHQEDSNETLKMITVLPIKSTAEQVHRLSSMIRSKEESKHLSTELQSIPTTMPPRRSINSLLTKAQVQTSRESRITTDETLTTDTTRYHPTSTFSKTPSISQTSTHRNQNKRTFATYKTNDDDDMMDDLFFS